MACITWFLQSLGPGRSLLSLSMHKSYKSYRTAPKASFSQKPFLKALPLPPVGRTLLLGSYVLFSYHVDSSYSIHTSKIVVYMHADSTK